MEQISSHIIIPRLAAVLDLISNPKSFKGSKVGPNFEIPFSGKIDLSELKKALDFKFEIHLRKVGNRYVLERGDFDSVGLNENALINYENLFYKKVALFKRLSPFSRKSGPTLHVHQKDHDLTGNKISQYPSFGDLSSISINKNSGDLILSSSGLLFYKYDGLMVSDTDFQKSFLKFIIDNIEDKLKFARDLEYIKDFRDYPKRMWQFIYDRLDSDKVFADLYKQWIKTICTIQIIEFDSNNSEQRMQEMIDNHFNQIN